MATHPIQQAHHPTYPFIGRHQLRTPIIFAAGIGPPDS
jgi:hypothetical protein